MNGDLPDAALRLMAQLQVRTHERRLAPTETRGGDTTGLGRAMPSASVRLGSRGRPLSPNGRGGQNRRSVIVNGKRYASIREATRKLGVSNNTIYAIIDPNRDRE